MRFTFFVSLALLLTIACGEDTAGAAKLITSSGGQFEMGKSVAGTVKLTNDSAFSILKGSKDKAIVAAGGIFNKGRVVAFTHGSFLKKGGILDNEAALNLVLNAMRWTGRSSNPVVGLHPSCAEIAEYLEKKNLKHKILRPADVEGDSVSTYCLIGHGKDLGADDIAYLKEFVARGGGLVVSTTPWAFGKKYPDFAKEFPANQLIAASGIEFQATGYASSKAPLIVSRSSSPDPTPAGPKMRPSESGDSKNRVILAAKRITEDHKKLSGGELSDLVRQLPDAKQLRGHDLDAFLPALKALNEAVGPIVPTKESPLVPGQNKLVDTIIDLETHFNLTLPAGAMYAIPASADYPGAVEKPEKPIIRAMSINGKYKGWLQGRTAGGWAAKEMRPTGIYAAPGEVIRVSVPAKIGGEGFEVIIGSYNGGLKNRDKWVRYPKLLRSEKIESRVTEISNGLGGLVNIRVPREADYEAIEISIEGGVLAPLYIHGETDLNEWKSQIRKRPAPWAELASERIIIALPSEYIRNLSDPDDIMKIWNEIIESAADLASVNRDNYRAERLVFDRQTAAGSMHSSYPVAAHTGGAAETAVDAKKLRKEGNWGFFHEYGHNHQHNLWALPGTGETTCNLWSVYISEELIGKDRKDAHSAMSLLNRRQKRNAYFSSGRPFESGWKVWTALDTYLLIQEEFGWEPFQKVFDEYNQLPQSEWPTNQQEKNDQWVIRLSKACGKNLHPYWKAWNLPMTSKVESELKDLPVWENHPVAKY